MVKRFRPRRVGHCASYRSWVVCRFYWSEATTQRNFNRAHKGLKSLGATKLDLSRDDATGQWVETWKVEAQGKPYLEIRRILRSFGIGEVCYGNGRTLHGAGAGKEFNPCHSKEAEAVYRQHKAYLETRLYRITQAMRKEARDKLAWVAHWRKAGLMGAEQVQALINASKINTPKLNAMQGAMFGHVRKIARMRAKLVAMYENGMVHESMADIVNLALERLGFKARHILEAMEKGTHSK